MHVLPPYDSMAYTGTLPLHLPVPVALLYRSHSFTYMGGWERGKAWSCVLPQYLLFSLLCNSIHGRYYVKSSSLRILTLNLLQMTLAGFRAITNTILKALFFFMSAWN
jgi:hypothetical protein